MEYNMHGCMALGNRFRCRRTVTLAVAPPFSPPHRRARRCTAALAAAPPCSPLHRRSRRCTATAPPFSLLHRHCTAVLAVAPLRSPLHRRSRRCTAALSAAPPLSPLHRGAHRCTTALVLVVFFCTPMISSSCPLLKLSVTTSLKSSCSMMFLRERLLIFTDSILFLTIIL
jgi:hypothetical protein